MAADLPGDGAVPEHAQLVHGAGLEQDDREAGGGRGREHEHEAQRRAPVVVLDLHAEATSEKVALSRWLDGRVTAVIGTHTHVQTNDARILPAGTAAVTDAGMTGPHDSVIGVVAELAIRRMRTRLPVRFQPAEGGVRIEGVVVDCTDDGRAERIELLRLEV